MMGRIIHQQHAGSCRAGGGRHQSKPQQPGSHTTQQKHHIIINLELNAGTYFELGTLCCCVGWLARCVSQPPMEIDGSERKRFAHEAVSRVDKKMKMMGA